jgi:hypothetical protein
MMIGMAEKVYRVNPWPLIVFFLGVVALLTFLSMQIRGPSISNQAIYVLLLLNLFLFSGLTLFIWAVFVVRVTDKGIRTTDGIGRIHSVKWENMQSVHTICGFYHVKHGKLGTALMFPVFLANPREFRADVISRTPPENALRQFLQKMPSV